MALQVCMGALMKCSFGVVPSSLIVLPTNRVVTQQAPDASVSAHKPMVNIPPFGMCTARANPTVASAAAAALGTLTPMPCIPNTPAPWAPGEPTISLGNFPALDNNSKLTCVWGGVIQFTTPGEFTVMEP